MKIIKITESQYKRLVSKKLNESIIYNNSEDKSDVTILISDFLKLLSDTLLINHKQNVYVDKIVDGVVYIDGTKYNEEEKNLIEYFIDWWIDNVDVNTSHKKIDGMTYDSGKDWDYNEDIVNDTKCWCKDIETGEEIEYLCVDELPNNCVKVDDVELDSSDIRQKIVDKASERLGEPYVWGGEFKGVGGDCSGLIDWTLRNVSGINSPYSGRETSDALHYMVTNENMGRKNGLDKGDILIFTPKGGEFTDKEKIGHVGFVYDVRGGKVDMIHSSSSKGVNIQKNVFANSYYKKHYYGAIPIVKSKYEIK